MYYRKDYHAMHLTSQSNNMHNFYRAMHYSAMRGPAIACRLSVRLSATLVDHDHIGLG